MTKIERKHNSIWKWYIKSLEKWGLTHTPKNLTPDEWDQFHRIYSKYNRKIINLGIIADY